ncbi:MAG: 4-(cytidine 5'-diphospho)-2-C-methyl-D-erythritol kinase [Oscillospiraceae bacterium]|nr:4-(cytidine 5'-diphospho)-2-C-methyl-D-erythritol kinase [Oscillospiraceae bacterium]
MIVEKAYAKINLTLDVLGKRADGYHELRSVMQTISLHDELTLTPNDSESLTVGSNCPGLPADEGNLAIKAANVFYAATGIARQGLHIHIDKRIPVCAGLGGGSADAAAVLRGLNVIHGDFLSMDDLIELAAQVGSDVPFCIRGGTQLACGRGEILTQLPPLPECCFILCQIGHKTSTADVFAQFSGLAGTNTIRSYTDEMIVALRAQDLPKIGECLGNALAGDVSFSATRETLELLKQSGALGVSVSGAGPTAFGLFSGNSPPTLALASAGRELKDKCDQNENLFSPPYWPWQPLCRG